MKRSLRTAFAFALAALCFCSGAAGAKIVAVPLPVASGIQFAGMNEKGQATGCYGDGRTGAMHGFLLAPDGALATFDVPVTMKSHGGVEMTCATGISADGTVSGWYAIGMTGGGFVRAADGAITTFTVGPFTEAGGMNQKRWIVGEYDRNQKHPAQAFLRDPSGATQEFSVPGAVYAYPRLVNRSRSIAGMAIVQTAPFRYQGFFRPAQGKAALFGDVHLDTEVSGMNDAGTVVGSFGDPHYTAFIRTSDGTLTTFEGPGGAIDTHAYGINNSGTIVGAFAYANGGGHSFLRAADGTFTLFDLPGGYQTVIHAINDKGVIAGVYTIQGGQGVFVGKP